MSSHLRYVRSIGCGVVAALAFSLSGCVTGPADQRIDNIPMYGQPQVPRPDFLKKADEDFIREASSGFGGSREVASEAWWAQAEKFMNQGNMDYAMRRYNQSWLLNPDNYQPYWGFGRVTLHRGKTNEAIEYFEKALKLCNDPYQKVALLTDTGTTYSKAASISTNSPEEKARYFQLANKHFMEGTKLDASFPDVWERWAHSLYREGKYSDSWKKIKIARSLGARNTEIFVDNLEKMIPEPK